MALLPSTSPWWSVAACVVFHLYQQMSMAVAVWRCCTPTDEVVFLLKQLWGSMAKHESDTVLHVTQQVVARLPKSNWVCSCHQPCLAGRGEVKKLKRFLCLHPPECLAVLDQGFLHVFFLTEFSEIIEHSIECIFDWYWSCVYRDGYRFIVLSPSPSMKHTNWAYPATFILAVRLPWNINAKAEILYADFYFLLWVKLQKRNSLLFFT